MTIIEQPAKLMAQTSVKLMLEKLIDPNVNEQKIFLKAKATIRESTDYQLDKQPSTKAVRQLFFLSITTISWEEKLKN